MDLIESVAKAAHEDFVRTSKAAGKHSVRLPNGAELLVPWEELDAVAQELGKATVQSVVRAADLAGYHLVQKQQ